MGIQASNSYNLTIPVAAIEPFWAEYKPMTYDFVDGKYVRVPAIASVDEMVRVITDAFGNDEAEQPEYDVIDGVLKIEGFTYGRLGDADAVAIALARHGATGIVWGEADGEPFLTELTDGDTRTHGGQVVFPTYKGSLYSSS
jgi:hypothetical protein